MNKTAISLLLLSSLVISCARNEATGEMEPKWVFWVLLGLIALGLIFGVVSNSMKRKKGDGSDETPSKTEQEIEKYEETLHKKEEEDEK